MRQVNARASAAARPARPAGRSKPVARMPEARPELRGNGGIKLGLEAGMTRLEWLRGTFPVRHPILSLSLFIGLVGVVSGLIAGGYAGRAVASIENALYGTMAEAGFAIHDIALTGNERSSDEEVRAAIGMKVGEPIFAVDPAQARAALMRLPWVSDADVQRTLPDKIAVRVASGGPAYRRIGARQGRQRPFGRDCANRWAALGPDSFGRSHRAASGGRVGSPTRRTRTVDRRTRNSRAGHRNDRSSLSR
jgi:hypothetical protein